MKVDQFFYILDSLDARISDCKDKLGEIHTTADLENLSISTARELRDFAKIEVEKQTKVAMVDFYHIIGMGDLTVTQTQQFISAMREYLSYRPLLKVISTSFLDLDDIPQIPVNTRYRTQVLGSVLLKSVIDEEAEEVELDADETTDSIIREAEGEICPFELEGRKIYIRDLKAFLSIVPKLKLSGGNLENFQRKAINGGEYLGITFEARSAAATEADPYVGKVTSGTVLPKLREYYGLYK